MLLALDTLGEILFAQSGRHLHQPERRRVVRPWLARPARSDSSDRSLAPDRHDRVLTAPAGCRAARPFF